MYLFTLFPFLSKSNNAFPFLYALIVFSAVLIPVIGTGLDKRIFINKAKDVPEPLLIISLSSNSIASLSVLVIGNFSVLSIKKANLLFISTSSCLAYHPSLYSQSLLQASAISFVNCFHIVGR